MKRMELPALYLKYASLFEANGFHLYLIGGSSRDLLLGLPSLDYDFVTDATPEQEKSFLPPFSGAFARFGSIKLKEKGVEVDITTMRKEEGYGDYRHPSKITFITSVKEDSMRRDFTVNALYIAQNGTIFDFHGGLQDLENKVIRFIGDPYKRIQEDPLRILRARRFAKRLGFSIDPIAEKAMVELEPLLSKLNPEKVKMEAKKE